MKKEKINTVQAEIAKAWNLFVPTDKSTWPSCGENVWALTKGGYIFAAMIQPQALGIGWTWVCADTGEWMCGLSDIARWTPCIAPAPCTSSSKEGWTLFVPYDNTTWPENDTEVWLTTVWGQVFLGRLRTVETASSSHWVFQTLYEGTAGTATWRLNTVMAWTCADPFKEAGKTSAKRKAVWHKLDPENMGTWPRCGKKVWTIMKEDGQYAPMVIGIKSWSLEDHDTIWAWYDAFSENYVCELPDVKEWTEYVVPSLREDLSMWTPFDPYDRKTWPEFDRKVWVTTGSGETELGYLTNGSHSFMPPWWRCRKEGGKEEKTRDIGFILAWAPAAFSRPMYDLRTLFQQIDGLFTDLANDLAANAEGNNDPEEAERLKKKMITIVAEELGRQ